MPLSLQRVRPHLAAIAGALVGIAIMAWLGLIDFTWSDYDHEAAAAFRALLHGDLGGFVEAAPTYGGSLVVRAPFAAAPALWGGGELAAYRTGSLACLVPAAVLGIILVARMRGIGLGRLARATALALAVASPITLRALEIGHPEEILGAALCLAAVLAASDRRVLLSGLLLGLAIATKAWALLAVGPVLLALPFGRWRALIAAGAVVAVVMAPLLLADHRQVGATAATMATTGTIFQPWQVWWFAGEPLGVTRAPNGELQEGRRAAPAWLVTLSHPLIVLLGAPLTLLAFLRRRTGALGDALLLLALLLLLRCVLDPWNNVYYHLPFLFALLGWETLARRQPPAITLAATVAVWSLCHHFAYRLPGDVLAVSYLAVALGGVVALTAALYGPRRAGGRLAAPGRVVHASTTG